MNHGFDCLRNGWDKWIVGRYLLISPPIKQVEHQGKVEWGVVAVGACLRALLDVLDK